CDNWNLLNGTGNTSVVGGVGNNSSAGNSQVRTYINGNSAPATRFGLGTEDVQDTSVWSYQSKKSGPKTTLNAAYAAAYSAPGGDFVLIFGGDRASTNGSTNIGLWLLQDAVAPIGSGGGGFTGHH